MHLLGERHICLVKCTKLPSSLLWLDCANGIPMPSNPEMGAFWSAMGPALTNITSGAQSPTDAPNDAAARILGE